MKILAITVLVFCTLNCSYIHYKGVTYINVGRKFTAKAETPEGYKVDIEAGVDKNATDAILKGIEIGKAVNVVPIP